MSNKTNFSINFYEVLGVEATASLKEIKKQYSKLVVKYHPDKTKDSYDTSIFELIQIIIINKCTNTYYYRFLV